MTRKQEDAKTRRHKYITGPLLGLDTGDTCVTKNQLATKDLKRKKGRMRMRFSNVG